jgi:hypothetical protein
MCRYGATIDVTVHIASFNTIACTELAVRTAVSRAGVAHHLVVGDAGSTDGSVALLEGFAADGLLDLELAPDGREHFEWLDHWTATCTTRWAVFVDSDVEFHRAGWLREILSVADSGGHALVCAELLPAHANTVEPVSHATVYLASRPAPWLLLIDCAQIRQLTVSFKWFAEPSDERHEGQILYDTGGKLFAALMASGCTWAAMPPSFQGAYTHFGNMSWAGRFGGNRRQRVKARRVSRRLKRVRRLTPDPA